MRGPGSGLDAERIHSLGALHIKKLPLVVDDIGVESLGCEVRIRRLPQRAIRPIDVINKNPALGAAVISLAI